MPVAAPTAVPLVGRAAERHVLRAALDGAIGGTGAVALVTGPAGIGKTRMLEQLTADANAAAVPIVWGRCPAEQGVPPLWPWQRVLAAAGVPPIATLAAGYGATMSPEDTAAVRLLVASAVTDALISAAAPAGLVVVLEDLHWADGASLDVLSHLAADVRRSRLLVVASARDADGRALPEPIADLVRLPGVELLALGPLSVAGVAAYLSAAEGRAVDQATVAQVHERSGGNPLFVRTLARVLGPDLGQPALSAEDVSRRLAGSSEVRSLVAATLRPLDGDVRELLAIASVLGEEIEPALLADVAEQPLAHVEAMLDAADRAGLLSLVPGSADTRRFAHALVRESVLAELPGTTRRGWHVRAATVLAAAAAERPDLAPVVTYHWLRGARTPEQLRLAVQWARTAAAGASVYAPEEAARLLTAALAASGAGATEPERASLLVELATVEYRAGAMAASLEHCRQASDDAEAAARPDLLAAAALVLRGVGHPPTAAVLAELCDRALRLGPHPPATVALLLAQQALAQSVLGRTEQARAGAVDALAAAVTCADPAALLLAVHARVDTLDCLSDPGERRALADRALAVTPGARQPLTRLWALLWRLDAAYQDGDPAAVAEEIARLEALVAGLPLPLARWHLLRVHAAHAAVVGDLPQARACNDEAARVSLQDPSSHGMSSAFRVCMAMLTGDPTELGEHWFASMQGAPDIPVIDANKAAVLVLLDRRDEAEVLYRKVLAVAPTMQRNASWTGTLDALVWLAEAFCDPEGARVLHDLVLPAARWSGGPAAGNLWSSGSGWRRVGRTAAVEGRSQDAVVAFEQALSADVAFGARPAAALDRLSLAELLADPDPTRARLLARQAASEARTVGLPGPLRRADQLVRRLDAATPDPLTGREREVAELVAQSMSNREVAATLVLSERTVESHVRNILAKLGLTRRTEIVRWVLASPADARSLPIR